MTAADTASPPLLVIGVGQADRGDDAVGLVVAQHVRAASLVRVTVVESTGEGTALLELWQAAAAVILVDAVQTGAAPGTVYRLDAREQPLPAVFLRYSTHAFGVAEAVELARALRRLPPSLVIYGIEGHDFTFGAGLSPAVARAVPAVVAQIQLQGAAHAPQSWSQSHS